MRKIKVATGVLLTAFSLDAAVFIVDEFAVQILHDLLVGGEDRVVQKLAVELLHVDVVGLLIVEMKEADGFAAQIEIRRNVAGDVLLHGFRLRRFGDDGRIRYRKSVR